MFAPICILVALPAGPDLKSHFRAVGGHNLLYVSREQWSGIAHSLFELDRRTLAKLTPLRGPLTLRVYWTLQKRLEDVTIDRKTFLEIGDKSLYGRYGGDSVGVVSGQPGYFQALWTDLARMIHGTKQPDTGKPCLASHLNPATWVIYGATPPKPGLPSTKIKFGTENGHLVFRELAISVEYGP